MANENDLAKEELWTRMNQCLIALLKERHKSIFDELVSEVELRVRADATKLRVTRARFQ